MVMSYAVFGFAFVCLLETRFPCVALAVSGTHSVDSGFELRGRPASAF